MLPIFLLLFDNISSVVGAVVIDNYYFPGDIFGMQLILQSL